MSTNKFFYINGKWVSEKIAKIPFKDAGFLYGDGLFETIRFNNNNPFKLKNHIDRLKRGCNTLNLNLTLSNSDIYKIINGIINKNDFTDGLIRFMITRGIMNSGTPWNYKGEAGVYVLIRPFSIDPKLPVKVVYYKENKYPIIRYNPAIKSMNYVGNLLAKKNAEDEGAYEPVFINNDGFVTECAIRNIFYVKNNILITPSINLGILPGVMRDTINNVAKEIKLKVEEKKIKFSEINSMEESFISSTGIGLYPCYWDNWNSDFQITTKIRNKLNEIILG